MIETTPRRSPLRPERRTNRVGRILMIWVRLLRPWFWPVGLLPMAAGMVLATGSLLPAPKDHWALAIMVLVVGPLVWGAVLLDNDLHDLSNDRGNPRRVRSPLVTGAAPAQAVRRVQLVLAGMAPLAALLVGPLFALGTAGVLLLGCAYNAPPWRLKSRPVADMAVNALAIGVLGPLAGWQLQRPLVEYPPALAGLGLALGAALYLPTTVMDLAADQAAGDRTVAVRFGARAVLRAGSLLWFVATIGWLWWGTASGLLVGSHVMIQAVCGAVLCLAYVIGTRRPSTARLALLCLGFCGSAGWFLLGHIS